MEEENNNQEWIRAVDSFSKHVDGFCIAGYTEGGSRKFIHGHAVDAPCADALSIVHFMLKDWLNEEGDCFNNEEQE